MTDWLARLRQEIEQAAGEGYERGWAQAPQGLWCAAQILEHLGRSYGGTAKALEQRMACAEPEPVRAASWPERVARWVVVGLGVMPRGRKAPAAVEPSATASLQARERALENLARMEQALKAAEARWGSRAVVAAHPILGPLKAEEWRKFHYVHGRHHCQQVRLRLHGLRLHG